MARNLTPEQAELFAKAYVMLVEALLREGVPMDDARLEARSVAYLLVWSPEEPEVPWED